MQGVTKRFAVGAWVVVGMVAGGCGGAPMEAEVQPGQQEVVVADVAPEPELGTVEAAVVANPDAWLRQANRYSEVYGYAAGFPNFHEANGNRGTLLMRPGSIAQFRDVYRWDLANVDVTNVPEMFRQASDYAVRNGLGAALPTFEQGHNGTGVVYGISFLNWGTFEFRDVYAFELGNPDGNDPHALMTAAHDYAVSHGFAAALPTFHSGSRMGFKVYGLNLIYHGQVDWRDVPITVLGMQERFTFEDATVTAERRRRLMQRHEFAFGRIAGCADLSISERMDLMLAYGRYILHHGTDDPTVNGRGEINGDEIWINFDNLFPLGDNEISQTLIHEMMHIAGYTHPDRQTTDSPGDNGPYYGTAPLRAELCIAGAQSLQPGHTNDQLVR